MKKYLLFVLGALILATAGCATNPISGRLRAAAQKDLTMNIVRVNPEAYTGKTVIWGGTIAETLNTGDGTEIVVMEAPLDPSGLPATASHSRGRFIVRSKQFLDPALFSKDKRITVAGTVLGIETRPLGGMNYTYPVLTAVQMHLWKHVVYEDCTVWEDPVAGTCYKGSYWE